MRAADYRKQAEETMRLARAAKSDVEREEYVRLSKAWTVLAEGAERGLRTDPARSEAKGS